MLVEPSEPAGPAIIVPEKWRKLDFFSNRWPSLRPKLTGDWLPGPHKVFAALGRLSPSDVRVIIIGQDPYPTPGHANGLAFSVNPNVALPASLRNIYKEMEADVGSRPANGDLSFLVEQGVLLLNTSLSVTPRSPGSHAGFGWATLVREVVSEAQKHRPLAFVLWGKHAQGAVGDLVREEDLEVRSAHPSPLSAHNGFFGSMPFSRVNAWLSSRGETEINWGGQREDR